MYVCGAGLMCVMQAFYSTAPMLHSYVPLALPVHALGACMSRFLSLTKIGLQSMIGVKRQEADGDHHHVANS